MQKNPRFAVILSGCGRQDGSEIHEATLALLAIAENNCTYTCFAPNIPQARTINHLTSEQELQNRNVLIESARIARGEIYPLSSINLNDFDCILLPGGLGAITNWCDFQTQGITCTVNETISKVLEQAYEQKKVIGAMCIAPMLLAKVLGSYGITITIGDDPKLEEIIHKMGAKSQKSDALSAVKDEKNLIATTPAYMLATSIKEVAIGAKSLVSSMIELANTHLTTLEK